MGIYPELDNLSLNELMDYWCREPIDGKEYAIVYYDEIAFLLSKQGDSGREFLANELNQENSPEKLCAILGFLPSPEHPVLLSTLLGNYSASSAGNTGLPINRFTNASSTGIPCFLRVDR
jgi:hypothetical protein